MLDKIRLWLIGKLDGMDRLQVDAQLTALQVERMDREKKLLNMQSRLQRCLEREGLAQLDNKGTPFASTVINELAKNVYEIAAQHGWWREDRNDGELIALMHSELSEALEALRMGKKRSEKIPVYSKVEEELADVIIRILDYSYAKRLDIGGALLSKIAYNKDRPYRHGGKNF